MFVFEGYPTVMQRSTKAQGLTTAADQASAQKMISVAGLSQQVLDKLCAECRPGDRSAGRVC